MAATDFVLRAPLQMHIGTPALRSSPRRGVLVQGVSCHPRVGSTAMDGTARSCESLIQRTPVLRGHASTRSGQSPGVRCGGCSLVSGSALRPLRSTFEVDEREVLPAGEETEGEDRPKYVATYIRRELFGLSAPRFRRSHACTLVLNG